MAKKYIRPILDQLSVRLELMMWNSQVVDGSYGKIPFRPRDNGKAEIVQDPPDDDGGVNAKEDTWGSLWNDSIGWDE